MRSGRFSRVSGFTDALAPLQFHSFCHEDGLQMGVASLVSEAMVDYYRISVVEQFECN